MDINSYRQRQARDQGFSLVELLAVIAIMALLGAMGAQMYQPDVQRRSVVKAADEIEKLLKMARWNAISQSTYTFVCFRSTGTHLEVVVFTSTDGTDYLGPDNLEAIARNRAFSDVGLISSTEPTPPRLAADFLTKGIHESVLGRLEGSPLHLTSPHGETYTNQMLQFNPSGIPSIPGASTPQVIELVFKHIRGSFPGEKATAVSVSRSTGRTRLFL